ncbi:MAG: winged helix-turn-helix domain-containing protein [Candidatus Syntrophoarchaeum sp.]|nr:winged helix-turn-helix domain-containing protein [Candidatus Syntrophoarchaeum sp.]
MSDKKRQYFGCPVKAFTDSDYERYDQFVEKYDDPEEGNRAYNQKYLMILANRTRRRVLKSILQSPKRLDEIAAEVEIDEVDVRFHLRVADFLLKPSDACEDGYYELNEVGKRVVAQFASKV